MRKDSFARKNRRIEVVFFDAGETLIHPHPSFVDLFVATCARGGVEVDRFRIPQVTRSLLREIEERQREGFTFTTSPQESRDFWIKFYADLLRELGGDGDFNMAIELYRTFSYPGNYTAYPDAREILPSLRGRGLQLGLISNFEEWLECLLEELGLLPYLDLVYISGKVGVEKPHPGIFQAALEGAGVEPERAMHVGDSLLSDVEGARSVGITPVIIDRFHRYPDVDCYRITDLRQLENIL